MRRWLCTSEEETRALGRRLAEELAPDGVLLLSGDLGAGKTVLAQGVGAGLGLEPGSIQSPSYTLIVRHDGGRVPFVHVDLYRLEPEETYALGLDEELWGAGVKIVEWAERLPAAPAGALRLRIRRGESDEEREILELEPE